jgi:1-acyl-sn-glycerol-3-phosphate acyltransferase
MPESYSNEEWAAIRAKAETFRKAVLDDPILTKGPTGNDPTFKETVLKRFGEYARLRQGLEIAAMYDKSTQAQVKELHERLDTVRPLFRIPTSKLGLAEYPFTLVRLCLFVVVFLCGGMCVCAFSPVVWFFDVALKCTRFRNGAFFEGFVVRYLFWRPLLAASFVDVKRDRSKQDWDESEGGIVVVNHASNLDGFVLGPSITPIMPKFLAKKELFYIPLFGWMALLLGHVLVNRKNRGKAVGALNKAAYKILKKDKRSIFISPEGTRTRDGNLVLPFKKGSFYIREQTGSPFFPCVIHGAFALWPPGNIFISPGEVLVENLPAIPCTADQSRANDRLNLQQIYTDLLYPKTTGKGLIAPTEQRPLTIAGGTKCLVTLCCAAVVYYVLFSNALFFLNSVGIDGLTLGKCLCLVHVVLCGYVAIFK